MRATHLTLLFIGISTPSLVSCSPGAQGAKEPIKHAEARKRGATETSNVAPGGSIGAATQEADGTIVLQLRATGNDAIGDGLVRYPPDHPNYAEVKAHVGPIPPGKSVPVKPFD